MRLCVYIRDDMPDDFYIPIQTYYKWLLCGSIKNRFCKNAILSEAEEVKVWREETSKNTLSMCKNKKYFFYKVDYLVFAALLPTCGACNLRWNFRILCNGTLRLSKLGPFLLFLLIKCRYTFRQHISSSQQQSI